MSKVAFIGLGVMGYPMAGIYQNIMTQLYIIEILRNPKNG